ncbi:histone [Burkholderia gladioli]|uniref:H-NS histone family protein n=1 Tax=Burkholderia TaxID=32008 RepID=UPI00075B3658|nr:MULTISPECIES: H-NS histone family protein [Burkholderia]KVM62620.1 histone [Burkholderia gladioli]NIE82319.1 H-NS histone family protein [Burkholderia sp. Tr-860]NIF61909.1 H-NS histone family protein [Burkholderia sp. Cy-647]NIF69767.1 H-NS histone family protein [Burkholderia sp. Ap-962]NIF89079.1 H-NS histone family protein [Burkholderia sp. Cy-637]
MNKTYPELLAECTELEAKLARARASVRDEALCTIRKLMIDFGIDADELTGTPGVKRPGSRAPKYWDPESGRTWTGRGRVPAWIAGKDRSTFEL